jgi:hypothetical protein
MPRYRIEFVTKVIDESRLRDILEREFALSGIGIVREHGPLSTTEIPSKMEVCFKNPRSIHLSLRSLAHRGVVRLVGVRGGVNLSEAGAQEPAGERPQIFQSIAKVGV